MSSSLTPQDFVAKWRRSALKESAAGREHFIDLWRLVERTLTNLYNARPTWLTRRSWSDC